MFWRKKFIFFSGVLCLALFFALAFFSPANAGTLSCSVASSCAGGVVIYRMSGSTNAHAEMPDQTTTVYNNNQVCCTGVVGLSHDCSGAYATALKLSGVTNAHTQQSGTYANNACISVPTGGSVLVGYQANNCDSPIKYDTTLGSMYAADNSHVGNAAAYNIKICASASGVPDPAISGMYTCAAGVDRDSACGFRAAPEHSVADNYGLIQLNGTNFGSTAGTVQFTGGFGGPISGTIHATAEGACTVGGWAADGTSVCVEVSSAIADNIYDGTVTLTRQSDSKQATIGLHIQPRIVTNNPTSGAPGDPIEINGNHFCQPSGTCPNQSLLPDADHIAFFGSTQAIASDFATTCSEGKKWSDTQVCVNIPAGTAGGAQKTKIQGELSPLYESQRKDFTVQGVTPDTPSNLKQSRNSGFTNLIPTGAYVSSTPVYFRFDTGAPVTGGMMYPQIEIRPVLGANKDFVSTCAAGTYCQEGTGVSYGGGTQTLTVSTSTPDNSYHWQVRAHYVKNSLHYYSAWQSYPVSGNPESETDLIVDTSGPIFTFTPSDSCAGGQTDLTANGVIIAWSLNESGDGQLVYSKNSDLSGSTNFPATPQAYNFTHSVSLSNLDSGTRYYYKVKSRDEAHNIGQRPPTSPYCYFETTSVTQPAKTTSFYIMGATDAISALATSSFSVIVPESAPAVKSAFVEITGLVSGGSNPIVIQANGVSPRTYVVDATTRAFFKFIYQISTPDQEANLNLNDMGPCTNGHLNAAPCNLLSITPGSGMTIDVYSARLMMTYGYTQ